MDELVAREVLLVLARGLRARRLYREHRRLALCGALGPVRMDVHARLAAEWLARARG